MKILITGASGFIGSFIVEEALRRGFDTWAAMRRSSKKDFLTDPRTHFIELDLHGFHHHDGIVHHRSDDQHQCKQCQHVQ